MLKPTKRTVIAAAVVAVCPLSKLVLLGLAGTALGTTIGSRWITLILLVAVTTIGLVLWRKRRAKQDQSVL